MPPVLPLQQQFLPTPSARRATGDSGTASGITFISTHALREEGDIAQKKVIALPVEFLPTPSARRATCSTRGNYCIII